MEYGDIAAFYRENPRMVSSPFGGIDGIDRELFAKVFDALDIDLTGLKVLDVGCGRGFVGELVREQGGSYVGADFVVSRTGFPLAQADAARLPFCTENFDAVFCIDAFEHFPRPNQVAAEIRRVLKPKGFFFLSAPNYSNVAGVVKKAYETIGIYAKDTWAPFGRWQAQEYESALTGRAVRRIFRRAGFLNLKRIGHGDETGLGLFPWIDHPRTPEAIQFRLQRLSRLIEAPVTRAWPGASLHGFWKMSA
ncbi:MAG: class I SAM-dependent methyltransferase [Candidatus Hydrogenedentes bacterium]|nr:class I SAM-dependent methyltransferase [Candidatus Hydrogenedentota bacterium]